MILVVGATGIVGGMVTRRLLEQGKEVRILVRHNSPSDYMAQQGLATPARDLVAAGAQPMSGDLGDKQALRQALQGVQTVIATANSAMRGGDDNVQSVDRDGNRRLVDAAAAAGVDHFIFVSALGAALDSPSDFLRAKAETERCLCESGMAYTILAPTAFFESWPAMVVGLPAAQGLPVTLVGEGRRLHSFISNQDVAAFVVAAVDNPDARNQYVPLGGPQPLSWRDVVDAYSQVAGRELPVNWVQPGDPVPGLPDPMAALLTAMEFYDSAVSMEDAAAAYGVSLTPLHEFARRQLSS